MNSINKQQEEIFISTPISSFSPEEFIKFKLLCGNLREELENIAGGYEIYCAVLNINSHEELDNPSASAIHDLGRIDHCAAFVLLYPNRLPSSALIELGYAVALKKNILIVAPDKDVLPFMAQELNIAFENIALELVDPFHTDINKLILQFMQKIVPACP